MKFDQPLVLKSIRCHQAEIKVGWVKVALVREVSTELKWWGGTVLDQITIPNYTTYGEAAADQHILRVPEAQQEYGDSYTIRVVSSEYGWASGILVFDNYTKIDAVY